MHIKGRGASSIDANLLANLATESQDGRKLTKSEAKKIIQDVTHEMKDEFEVDTAGLKEAEKAVKNTVNLAIHSGWVEDIEVQALLEAFVKGDAEESLKALVQDIRVTAKESCERNENPTRTYTPNVNQTSRSGYTPRYNTNVPSHDPGS